METYLYYYSLLHLDPLQVFGGIKKQNKSENCVEVLIFTDELDNGYYYSWLLNKYIINNMFTNLIQLVKKRQ